MYASHHDGEVRLTEYILAQDEYLIAGEQFNVFGRVGVHIRHLYNITQYNTI